MWVVGRLRLLSLLRDFLFSRSVLALGDILTGRIFQSGRSVCPDAQAPSDVSGCCPSGELWKAVLQGRALGLIAFGTGQCGPTLPPGSMRTFGMRAACPLRVVLRFSLCVECLVRRAQPGALRGDRAEDGAVEKERDR